MIVFKDLGLRYNNSILLISIRHGEVLEYCNYLSLDLFFVGLWCIYSTAFVKFTFRACVL